MFVVSNVDKVFFGYILTVFINSFALKTHVLNTTVFYLYLISCL